MYFTVPLNNSGETITDTPVNVRSIRSIRFFDKGGELRTAEEDFRSDRYRVSVFIDGRAVCENLFFLPFMEMQYQGVRTNSYDYRKISIPCLKNVNASEIKVIPCGTYTDYEVVFECSETPVESEMFLNIESFFGWVGFPNEKLTEEVGLRDFMINSGSTLTLETKREADRFFFYSCERNYLGYVWDYLPHLTFTWISETEEFPEDTFANLLCCGDGNSWKEAVYYLSKPFTKHPQIVFKNTSSEYDEPITIFLAHEDKF